MQLDKCALIIPSTIHVSAPNTALLDPNQRLTQYLDAISFFIKTSPLTKIIVCDNSGYHYPGSLVSLAGFYGKEIELLSFVGDKDQVIKCGKGYGEGEILKYALSNSMLIREVDGFLKVTGRLKVLNVAALLQKSDSRKNYFMPVSLLRPRFMVPLAARSCVDTRVYYTTRDFFSQVLLDAYQNVSDETIHFLEHAYYSAIASSPSRVQCFPVAPEIIGISGSNGWNFHERSRLKKIMVRIAAALGYIRPI
jgi:hypothetical protein